MFLNGTYEAINFSEMFLLDAQFGFISRAVIYLRSVSN